MTNLAKAISFPRQRTRVQPEGDWLLFMVHNPSRIKGHFQLCRKSEFIALELFMCPPTGDGFQNQDASTQYNRTGPHRTVYRNSLFAHLESSPR